MARRPSPEPTPPSAAGPAAPTDLRIIGGRLRGRRLAYSGDPRTRPMKDRVREALFNLVGGYCAGKHAVDLFAGTGALAFEAISRGAARATLIERHFPTARLLRDNARALGLEDVVQIEAGDAFFFARDPSAWGSAPWLLLCSPPWSLLRERATELMELLARLMAAAPAESVLVVEGDVEWDPAALPDAARWRVRDYPPARLAVLRDG